MRVSGSGRCAVVCRLAAPTTQMPSATLLQQGGALQAAARRGVSGERAGGEIGQHRRGCMAKVRANGPSTCDERWGSACRSLPHLAGHIQSGVSNTSSAVSTSAQGSIKLTPQGSTNAASGSTEHPRQPDGGVALLDDVNAGVARHAGGRWVWGDGGEPDHWHSHAAWPWPHTAPPSGGSERTATAVPPRPL